MSGKDTPLQPLSSNAVSAKDLARSLGLVKKRPSSTTSRSKDQEKEIKPSQYFAYLIVLDFESTCWKDKKMSYGPEIIEFPAVLLNTSTGELESEFHMFVQPSEHRKLSEFCTELTGITQIQVDEGVPVGTCLMLFGRWLQEMKDKKHFKFPCDRVLNKDKKDCMQSLTKWCTFVTWSDWDLGTCLKNECYRKQLRMPHPLRSWIDLRATYKSFYSRKPQGLAGALQDLGIKFTGREHSGLDDARNTAHLAWRMICDGSIMQITKSIDGMVEKLWNIVTKRVYSQSNLGGNVSGTTHTNTNNEDLFVLKDIPALHTKHQVVLSTPEGKNINESLNFNRTQPGNHSGCGEEQNVNGPAKHQSTRKEVDHPCDKMTKIKEKDLVLRIQGNEYSNENYQIGSNLKRRASASVGSSAMANLSVMSCAASTDMPITTKSLITPATSLSGPNKRPMGCCAGDIRTETPKSSTEGFLLKRGLVKQTLSYNQHTPPSGSHNHHISHGTGQMNNAAANMPCKASNIEPQAVKTPLFRVLTKQSFLSDRKPIEVLNKANSKACASVTPRTIAQTANKLAARATTVTAKPRSMHLYRPCTTPVGKTYAFTPPPVASSKMNPPITPPPPPVACFNGGSVTPPLCHCGRRTRRRSVINPGPNQGRAFFTCSINHGRSSLGANVDKKKSKSGCNFFRWEVRL